MIIFPAIDLRNGKAVRLVEGDFKQETVYAEDPAAVAEQFRDAGAEFLHVVDLDGALADTLQPTCSRRCTSSSWERPRETRSARSVSLNAKALPSFSDPFLILKIA